MTLTIKRRGVIVGVFVFLSRPIFISPLSSLSTTILVSKVGDETIHCLFLRLPLLVVTKEFLSVSLGSNLTNIKTL